MPRLDIPELCFADAPAGIRGQEFVSAFPAGIHLGATFDKGLMLRYGQALGREFKGKGIHIALGPFIGPIGRVVRGGRNWEGMGADPYLNGVGGGLLTRGTQEAGVMATPKVGNFPKHFENIENTRLIFLISIGLLKNRSTDVDLEAKARPFRQMLTTARYTSCMLGPSWMLSVKVLFL